MVKHGEVETTVIWPRIAVVVEEDSALRTVLTEALTEAGFRVQADTHPPHPAEIGRLQPDVVLIDLTPTSGAAGIAWLRALRDDDRTSEITVVVCTSTGCWHGDVEGEGLASRVLVKPFGIAELLAAVATGLRPARHLHRLN